MAESMFSIIAAQMPDVVDEVGDLFDSDTWHGPVDDNQAKLSVLAAILCELESHPEDGSDLSVPYLRYLRALETAYALGKRWTSTQE